MPWLYSTSIPVVIGVDVVKSGNLLISLERHPMLDFMVHYLTSSARLEYISTMLLKLLNKIFIGGKIVNTKILTKVARFQG